MIGRDSRRRRHPDELPPARTDQPVVIPVLSGAGGVGRSSVSAVLAAGLARLTARYGAVGVADTAPRGRSPWPEWISQDARAGAAALVGPGGGRGRVGRSIAATTSMLILNGAAPLRIWTDVGPLDPFYGGIHPGPHDWWPLLSDMAALVIDGDPHEGQRLIAHPSGGPRSVSADWLSRTPEAAVVPVWVTTTTPTALRQTLQVVGAAEDGPGQLARQLVVVVNDQVGGRMPPAARARLALLEGRVAAIVRLPHWPMLRRADVGCPDFAALAAHPAVGELVAAALHAAAASTDPPPPPLAVGYPPPWHGAGSPWPTPGLMTGPVAPPPGTDGWGSAAGSVQEFAVPSDGSGDDADLRRSA